MSNRRGTPAGGIALDARENALLAFCAITKFLADISRSAGGRCSSSCCRTLERSTLLVTVSRRCGARRYFPSRVDHSDRLSTRQYARLVDKRITGVGLRRDDYGTRSLRPIKASIICMATANCGQFRSCSVTARSRIRSGISGSMSKMPRPLQSKQRFERVGSPLKGEPIRSAPNSGHPQLPASGKRGRSPMLRGSAASKFVDE